MKYQTTALAERFGSTLFGLVVACGIAAAPHDTATAAPVTSWPDSVTANYQITFNGFDIGSFRFKADVAPEGYRLTGHADISALLGIIEWRGLTKSAGRVHGNKPQPSDYSFNFRSKEKAGTVKMGFGKHEVTSFSMRPLMPPKPGEVPLERKHLKKVVDPLTAVMAMTRAPGRNPCAMTIPVFDGKQRFNLALAYKGQEQLPAIRGAKAQVGFVCQVRYQPIAGYVPDSATIAMANERDIEIVLRPVRDANLMVPHEIRIPTIAGTARLTSKSLHVRGNDSGQLISAKR
ncbi:MAG: DUF3108 domain-containing protein [Hyphomicrobiaceae bacterium]